MTNIFCEENMFYNIMNELIYERMLKTQIIKSIGIISF